MSNRTAVLNQAPKCPKCGELFFSIPRLGLYHLCKPTPWRCGLLFRWGSLWIGAHYAGTHKRLCINLIPCVTLWITAPGGDVP